MAESRDNRLVIDSPFVNAGSDEEHGSDDAGQSSAQVFPRAKQSQRAVKKPKLPVKFEISAHDLLRSNSNGRERSQRAMKRPITSLGTSVVLGKRIRADSTAQYPFPVTREARSRSATRDSTSSLFSPSESINASAALSEDADKPIGGQSRLNKLSRSTSRHISSNHRINNQDDITLNSDSQPVTPNGSTEVKDVNIASGLLNSRLFLSDNNGTRDRSPVPVGEFDIRRAVEKALEEYDQDHFKCSSNQMRQARLSKKEVQAKPTQKVSSLYASAAPDSPLVCHYGGDSTEIPPYQVYLPVQRSVLAPNNAKLLAWPRQDLTEKDESKRDEELMLRYILGNPTQRALRLALREEARQLGPYFQDAAESSGIALESLVRYYLSGVDLHAPKTSLDNIMLFKANVQKRSQRLGGTTFSMTLDEKVEVFLHHDGQSVSEQFDMETLQDALTSEESLDQVPKPTHEATVYSSLPLGMLKVVEDSLSSETQRNISPKSQKHSQPSAVDSLTCDICYTGNCPFHGAFEEMIMESDVREKDDDNGEVFDGSNRRQRIQPGERIPALGEESAPMKTPAYWENPSNSRNRLLLNDRTIFFPCNHDGDCESVHCSCFDLGIQCETMCRCASTCGRRYPGCNCARTNSTCSTEKCLCVRLNRECDADLCGKCGASEMLDPQNRFNDDAHVLGTCRNIALQLGKPIRLLIQKSQVAGWGLFVGQEVPKGHFVGEYTGEAVSTGEGNRRGSYYHYARISYQFRLCDGYELDPTSAGLKTRFMNNSKRKDTINIVAKMKLCRGVLRLGFYANRKLYPGEELFWDYGYEPEDVKHFVEAKNGLLVGQQNPADLVGSAKFRAKHRSGNRVSGGVPGNARAKKASEFGFSDDDDDDDDDDDEMDLEGYPEGPLVIPPQPGSSEDETYTDTNAVDSDADKDIRPSLRRTKKMFTRGTKSHFGSLRGRKRTIPETDSEDEEPELRKTSYRFRNGVK